MPFWYWDKHAIMTKTPSIQDGMDYATEYEYRKEGARFIKDIGSKMDLGYNTMATGVVFFHRFYMFKSFKKFPRYVTACCCLFLAGKAEETPKKCKDIIKIAKLILSEDNFATFGTDPKEKIMTLEKILLQTIKFDFKVQHPYSYLTKYAKCLKGNKAKLQKMVQMAWTFINDSLCTTLSIEWEPEIIAIAVMYLAGKLIQFKIVDWKFKTFSHINWWDVYVEELDISTLEDICHQILDLYSKATEKQESDSSNVTQSDITNSKSQPSGSATIITTTTNTVVATLTTATNIVVATLTTTTTNTVTATTTPTTSSTITSGIPFIIPKNVKVVTASSLNCLPSINTSNVSEAISPWAPMSSIPAKISSENTAYSPSYAVANSTLPISNSQSSNFYIKQENTGNFDSNSSSPSCPANLKNYNSFMDNQDVKPFTNNYINESLWDKVDMPYLKSNNTISFDSPTMFKRRYNNFENNSPLPNYAVNFHEFNSYIDHTDNSRLMNERMKLESLWDIMSTSYHENNDSMSSDLSNRVRQRNRYNRLHRYSQYHNRNFNENAFARNFMQDFRNTRQEPTRNSRRFLY